MATQCGSWLHVARQRRCSDSGGTGLFSECESCHLPFHFDGRLEMPAGWFRFRRAPHSSPKLLIDYEDASPCKVSPSPSLHLC
ncbi:hypothetical protein M407DRAFT_243423 [Tulasnella calospora MUT 4182]|uniref:Uncharacterized protein n=1 Tax=Tulasnella calospora MUT 4182 TaxID=1051891 RepID=A0A0C3QL28_9AGAM|nr:hypothetical protein M407DRAFT_243423 [Tulasnella calospora MUT 4182]